MTNHIDTQIDTLELDFSDLEIENLEVLLQDGAKGTPDFAASSGGSCTIACASSCSCGN